MFVSLRADEMGDPGADEAHGDARAFTAASLAHLWATLLAHLSVQRVCACMAAYMDMHTRMYWLIYVWFSAGDARAVAQGASPVPPFSDRAGCFATF